MSWVVAARTASPAATRELAASLAAVVRRGDVVVLAGGLGAGKTTFAQGFARALGVEGPVTSPTFTLVRQYPCRLGQLVHADVYRLDHLAEVSDLGLSELVESGVALVEWGDVAAPVLGPVTFTVSLVPDGEEARALSVAGEDDSRRAEVAAAVGPFGRGAGPGRAAPEGAAPGGAPPEGAAPEGAGPGGAAPGEAAPGEAAR